MTKKEVENAIGNHADWIEHLAAAQAKTDEQIARTQAQIEQTNRTLRELGEETDKRIRDLVSAIGEFISAKGPKNGKA